MAKRYKGNTRISKEVSKDLTFIMKESGPEWITGTLYHKAGGMVSVPLDLVRAGDQAGASNLVTKSKRIVTSGDVQGVLALIFKNREEFLKKLDE